MCQKNLIKIYYFANNFKIKTKNYFLTSQNSTTESNEIRSDSNGSKSIQHQQVRKFY